MASQVGFRRQPTVDTWHPIPPGTSPPAERALEGTSAWALPLMHARMPVGTRACTQAYTHARACRNTLKHACTQARDRSLQTDTQAGGHPDAHPHKYARTAHTHTQSCKNAHTPEQAETKAGKTPDTRAHSQACTHNTHTNTKAPIVAYTNTRAPTWGFSHKHAHCTLHTGKQAHRHAGGRTPHPREWVGGACLLLDRIHRVHCVEGARRSLPEHIHSVVLCGAAMPGAPRPLALALRPSLRLPRACRWPSSFHP